MNLRKYFLRGANFENLCKIALKISEKDESRTLSILCVKIFINVCSLSGTRIYIPGETTIAE